MQGSRVRRSGPALAGMLIVCALALPASAGAGPVDDACRANSGPPSMCIGLAKVGERASAECRRLGATSDEQCVLPVGRRVIRAEVDAYQSSWTHRALGLQYALGNDVALRNAPWIGTHNSFNSTSEFPTASHTDSNQQLSLVDQLRIDMRKLEIDVHWIPTLRANGANAPVVCHGRGADEMHAGCTTERLFSETMVPIAGWLREHPGQVLLLYVEDNTGSTEGQEATAAVLDQEFGDLLYRPTGGASCSLLPLDLTRRDVLNAGAQVVVVSGCGSGSGWRGTVFNWDGRPANEADPVHVETSTHGYGADCKPDDFSRATYDTRLVRYYEDSTWLSATIAPGDPGYYDAGVTAANATNMVRCGVDLIDFDQIVPDDRLDAVVWSWARNEPSAEGNCAAQGSDLRWRARSCRQKRLAACQRSDGGWTLSKTAVNFKGASAACRSRGAVFAVPRTGYENQRLGVARPTGTGEIWLGHYRSGSAWVTVDPAPAKPRGKKR
jgi:hypothetical protein